MRVVNRKTVQDAGRIEHMMVRYQRQSGSVTMWHTIHDIAFRANLGTINTKKAVAYLHNNDTITAKLDKGIVVYSINGVNQ